MAIDDRQGKNEERAFVSVRTMDIVAALLFLCVSAIVIVDANRLGFNWRDGEGPASGYFPFYVALIMAAASIVNLVRAVLRVEPGGDETFVTTPALGRVLTVLIPTLVYVGSIGYVGIYYASGGFIIAFMLYFGRQNPLKALLVGIVVPIALFFMFEKWFLVPLPKCKLEVCDHIEEVVYKRAFEALGSAR